MSAGTETPRTPKALQKRKLTIAQAVDQWTECKRAIEGLAPLLKEAGEALVAHGEKTGRRTFKDQIAMERSGGSLVLDQSAVHEALPAGRFVEGDLMKRSKLGWTLKLLK